MIVADRPGANHVLEILDKLGCDLIVMGTHGHSWLKHRLFGSVTEEVVRLARCPVMVVKAPPPKPDPSTPEPAQASEAFGDAERLSRGQDFTNQMHLAELSRATNQSDRAREHYLDALALAGGPPPQRHGAAEALRSIEAGGQTSASFDTWLEGELTRRREERRTAALKSVVDHALPKLALTSADGKPYDAAGLRGKVLLLNFFASW